MEAVADAYGEVIHLYDRRYLVKKYLLNTETICFHKSDFFTTILIAPQLPLRCSGWATRYDFFSR
jgi:hypothetical protein